MKYLLLFLACVLMSFSHADAAKIDASTICKVVASQNDGPKKNMYVGTGFIYHQDEDNYYIMTNGHTLVRSRAGVSASFYKDDYMTTLVNCTVIRSFYESGTSKDVAILSVKKNDIPYSITPLKMSFNKVKPNTIVFGSGYPSGFWQQEWSGRVLPGNFENVTIVNMPSVNGQSGSPVCEDIEGENYVVGMITYRFNNSVLPAKSTGGYIDMQHISDTIHGITNEHDKISFNTGIEIASAVINDAYLIVNSRNEVTAYYTIRGVKYPHVYTLEECSRMRLPDGYAFCPYDEHPGIKKQYPILDRLPTINKPKRPWLPPFNKPATPKNNPKPNQFWPGGSPNIPKNAEKPDTESDLDSLKEKYNKTVDDIEKAIKQQKRLSNEALEAERKVWAKRQADLEKQNRENAKRIAELEAKLAEGNKQEKKGSSLIGKVIGKVDKVKEIKDKVVNKVNPSQVVETSTESKSFFGKVLGGITMIPSKLGGMLSGVSDSVTPDGVFWTILASGASLLIPGVRGALIARGVSPVLIKIGAGLIKSGGILGKIKKKVSSIKDGDQQTVTVKDDEVTSQEQTPVPWPSDYGNVQVVNGYSEEIEKKTENIVNSGENSEYNNANNGIAKVEPVQKKVNNSIKQIVEARITSGQTLQDLSYLGHLYQQGVAKLKNGELRVGGNNATVQSHVEAADAIERWVRTEFVTKVTQTEVNNPTNEDYLFAYKGMLYQEGVEMLKNGRFVSVLNYTTAAEAVERWVEDLLYEKLTRNI